MKSKVIFLLLYTVKYTLKIASEHLNFCTEAIKKLASPLKLPDNTFFKNKKICCLEFTEKTFSLNAKPVC